MIADWQPQTFALKFQFGELTFAQVELCVLHHNCDLHQIRVGGHLPELPKLEGTGLAGYLVRCQPAPGEPGSISRERGYLAYCLKSYQHSYIDMTQGFGAYQARFSGKTLSTLNRKIRKLKEHCSGTLDFRRYARSVEMSEFYRQARIVSARTYQERLLDCGLPDDPRFAEEMACAAGRDSVRGFLLFHDDRPVSYLYCPLSNGTVIYAHLGYDPDYRALSVGTVLQWLSLQSLFAERRFTAFDFTEGDSDHKRFFSTHAVHCRHLLVLTPSPKHRLLVASHRACDRISAWLGSTLERYGLKLRVKKWLRGAV